MLNIPSTYKKLINKPNNNFKYEIQRLKKMINKNDLIISGGGFSSYIVYKLKHKLTINLEQNNIIGDSNILLSLISKKIISSMNIKFNPFFYKTKILPSPSIFRFKKINSEEYKDKIIFIFGSLSSKSLINKTIKYFLSSSFCKNEKYILFVGKFIDEYKSFNLNKNIEIKDKIDNLYELKNAKLIFSRAGGTTISEMLYLKIPFVLIPSPYVKHNHQVLNAKNVSKKHNIIYCEEKNYNFVFIKNTIENINKYKSGINWLNYPSLNEKYKEIIDGIFKK